MKKTIGKAPCVLCKGGPFPVKISDSGNLYMVCPPPNEGGCKNQFFCRDAHSNRLLAQSITEWSVTKEERERWIGQQANLDGDELADELAEAVEDGSIQMRHPASPPPPPPPPPPASRKATPPRRTASRSSPPKPADKTGFKAPWEW